MSWLADVASGQQIIATWGNAVRNRIVQTFDSAAEANAHLADLPDGATASIPTLRQMFAKWSGAWYPMVPIPYVGGVAGGTFANGQGATTASFTIPAGFRNALLAYQVLIAGSSAVNIQLKCFTSNGGIQAAAINWYFPFTQTDTRVFSQLVATNINGDIITISLNNVGGGGSFACYSDSQNHNFCVIGYP